MATVPGHMLPTAQIPGTHYPRPQFPDTHYSSPASHAHTTQGHSSEVHITQGHNSQAHITKAIIEGILCSDDTNVNGPVSPDAIIGEHIIHLINALAKLLNPLIDVIQKAQWQVLQYSCTASASASSQTVRY